MNQILITIMLTLLHLRTTLADSVERRLSTLRASRDAGMSTAEYAVGILAAVAFATLLYKVLTSSQSRDLLTSLLHRALSQAF
jgi:hypothetical protein